MFFLCVLCDCMCVIKLLWLFMLCGATVFLLFSTCFMCDSCYRVYFDFGQDYSLSSALKYEFVMSLVCAWIILCLVCASYCVSYCCIYVRRCMVDCSM